MVNGQWSMPVRLRTPSSAACAQPGVLRARGDPLTKSAARSCREGGARVAPLADLNIHTLSRIDDRRIEVIANGSPMWGGSQLAVDTTLISVSPGQVSQGHGEEPMPEPHCRMHAGARKGLTQNFFATGDVVLWSWASRLEGGGATRYPALSACLPKPELDPGPHQSAQPPHLLWCPAGLALLTHGAASCPPTRALMEIVHPSANSSIRDIPTPAQLCRPVTFQAGRQRPGLRLPRKLANIKTVAAWRLPRKTAPHPRAFLRLKRREGKKIQNPCRYKHLNNWRDVASDTTRWSYLMSKLFFCTNN